MEELQDNEFLLIVDWKMKIQMMLYRESMVQFFGKRGISLLGVAIVRKRTAEELGQSKKLSKFLVEFHDLISDNTTEDTFAAISAIEGLLKILRKEDKYRKYDSFKVYSDSAGCFSSNEMTYWLGRLFKTTGFKCLMHFLSESGEGKTFLDAHFAFIMVYMKNRVVEGRGSLDVIDASSAAKTLSVDGGIENTRVFFFVINREKEVSIKKINYISSYHSRLFQYDQNQNQIQLTLRLHSFRSTKEKVLDENSLKSLYAGNALFTTNCVINECTSDLDEANSEPIRRKRKFKDIEQKIANPTGAPSTEGISQNRLHCCTDPLCAAGFVRPANLQKHLQSGGHFYGKSGSIHTHRRIESWIPPTERISNEIVHDHMIDVVKNYEDQVDSDDTRKFRKVGDGAETLTPGLHASWNGLIDEYFSFGYGEFKSPSREQKTMAQLKFILEWLKMGEESESGKQSILSASVRGKLIVILDSRERKQSFPRKSRTSHAKRCEFHIHRSSR